jgi:hypothetical protein
MGQSYLFVKLKSKSFVSGVLRGSFPYSQAQPFSNVQLPMLAVSFQTAFSKYELEIE